MTAFRPGDRVLYRDGDSFGVARVDLVKDQSVTLYPFDLRSGTWSTKNRRLLRSLVVGKLSRREKNSDRAAEKVARLAQERDALRRQLDRQLESAVQELIAP
ncbi:MAG: hypothetical protein H2049_00475 [Porphyrobacter sp.]|nr:hypothetical protein [Porphyrobacter sp.]